MSKKVFISSMSIMLSIFLLSCDLRRENVENEVDSVISLGKNYWGNLDCKYLSGTEKSIFNALDKSKKNQVFDSILKEENVKSAKQLLINWGIDSETASSIAIRIDKELVELKNSQIKFLDKDSYEYGYYNMPYSNIGNDNDLLNDTRSFDSNNDNTNKNYSNNQSYAYQEYTNEQAQEMQERLKKYKIFKENAYKLSQTLKKSTSYAEELNTKLSGTDNKENEFILKVEDIKEIIRLIARIKMTQYTDLSKKILDNNFSSITSDEESNRYVLLYKNKNNDNGSYLQVRKILGTILSKISSIVGGYKTNIVDIKDPEKIKKAKEHAQGVLDILKLIDSGETVKVVLNKAKELENIKEKEQ
ncbi:hypothetical protein [Borreliella tanukii]|uniref:hypothetical protein n=1 Tax=Borreliella tanukii TaxID=56146 RepID=UPI0026481890|nr:hypothetical protein [Borreliella tanukii]WKC82951.1 hypothetical protein QIA26_04790 [Borreliella tanukii]